VFEVLIVLISIFTLQKYYLSVDMPDFEHYGKLCMWSLEESLFRSFLFYVSDGKPFFLE